MGLVERPKTMALARRVLAEAKQRGARPLCDRCRKPASVAIGCETGEFHGVSCAGCWQAHQDFIASARIFQASGMADTAFCSRCGVEAPSDSHIISEEI